jgi:hypothetical protein
LLAEHFDEVGMLLIQQDSGIGLVHTPVNDLEDRGHSQIDTSEFTSFSQTNRKEAHTAETEYANIRLPKRKT